MLTFRSLQKSNLNWIVEWRDQLKKIPIQNFETAQKNFMIDLDSDTPSPSKTHSPKPNENFWDLSKSKCIPGTDKKGLWSREISPILENSQRNSPLWAVVGRSIIQGGGGREVREISQIRQHRFCLLRKSNSPVQRKIHRHFAQSICLLHQN